MRLIDSDILVYALFKKHDAHPARLCKERKLILENPIPREVREKMKI